MKMGPYALLFFSSLLIFGSVVSQTLNYCPPQSVFDSSFPVACSSFGTGHIHTWDGVVYDFHEYGDFFLVADIGNGFSVQVRQIDCQSTKTQAIPITTTTEYSATCVKSYVIVTLSGAVEFSHNLNNDYLNVTVNGLSRDPLPFDSLGGVSWSVAPVYYTNPYKSWQRDDMTFMPDADFEVVFYNAPVSITIRFFSTGYSMIYMTGELSQILEYEGLCGFADGCAANDLTLAEMPLEPLPYGTDASKFTATVNNNAGRLSNGRVFVNNTKEPNNWVPYLGSSWRVSTVRQSEFTTPSGDLYNIRLIKTKYPAPQTNCDWPKNWDIPSFFASACAQDNAASSDSDGFDQFPAKALYLDYCNYYCASGVFPFRNPALQAHQCNGFCEYPKGVSDPEMHATYNNVTFPPYMLQFPTDSLALFTSKLSLGGTYTFNLVTNDSCEYRAYNLTRSIKCTNALSVDTFQQTPSTFVARNHWYNFPRVCVVANVPSRLVRASWMALSWPGTPGDKPTLSNPLSFVPCFTPVLPGNYTFEQAVYDGCQIKKQKLSIIAECSSCPSASIIGLDNVKEVLWGLDFNSASNGISKSATTTYPTKTLIARSQNKDWPTHAALNYYWSIVNEDDDRDVIINPLGTPNYAVYRYPDGSVNEFAMMHPNGVFVNSTTGPWTSVPSNITTNTPGYTLGPLKGPIGTTYGVYPPQREFAIQRSVTVRRLTTVVTSTAYNVTYVHAAVPPVQRCLFSFGATQNSSTSTLTTTSALPTSQWNYGAGCVGDYNLQLQVSEAFCQSATDVQKVVVDCGLAPQVSVACDARVQYNFGSRLFPLVTIDASRTADVYGRGVTLLYTIIPPTSNSTANTTLNPPACGTTGCTSLNPTFTPDVDGTYIVQVQASTSCNSSAVNTSIIAWCNGTSSQINAQYTVAGGPSHVYDGTAGSQQIALDASASTTGAPGSTPTYMWTVEYTPRPLITPPSFNNPTLATPTLFATVEGTYQVTLRVSQGCNQSAVNVQSVSMLCDAAVAASISPASPINVPYTNPTGWADQLLTSTSSYSANTAPAVAAPTQSWLRHAGTTTTSLGTATTANVVAPSYFDGLGPRSITVELIFGDACRKANTSVQINYQCFALDPIISAIASPVQSGATITLDATTSTVNPVGSVYFWSIVSAPGGSASIINPNAPTATFVPLWGGSYTVMLQISDSCSTVNKTATFTVNCDTVGLAFSPTANPQTITWSQNAFSQIALAASFVGYKGVGLYTWQWRVTGAPLLSLYYPNQTVTSVTTNSTITTTIPDGNYQYILYNMTLVQVNTTVSNSFVLPNSATDPRSIFPSCFYPDLEGAYQLELMASDSCQSSTQTFSVNAQCAAMPTISLQLSEHANFNSSVESRYVNNTGTNAWTVGLSRAAPRRVVLDARGSSSSSNSRLTYYWAWAAPDPRANTMWAQDNIETPYASTAALVLSQGGNYYLSLVVHDGCKQNILNFTVTATCTEPKPTLSMSADTSLDGSQYYTFALQFAKDDNQTLCSSNQWQLINYTAAPSGNDASHFAVSLPLLFSLASLLALLF